MLALEWWFRKTEKIQRMTIAIPMLMPADANKFSGVILCSCVILRPSTMRANFVGRVNMMLMLMLMVTVTRGGAPSKEDKVVGVSSWSNRDAMGSNVGYCNVVVPMVMGCVGIICPKHNVY
ncbi:hypothetical protein E3N88_04157 [Mikania micrantha]|uniref:Uncharacterized protein n=1 Tax=Mikania micrantha TaxID=192012 RepID=A0A5N6PTM0_9ASTR|nr:hypothetical protein E3N88_04157 [Mikania micrantha]